MFVWIIIRQKHLQPAVVQTLGILLLQSFSMQVVYHKTTGRAAHGGGSVMFYLRIDPSVNQVQPRAATWTDVIA